MFDLYCIGGATNRDKILIRPCYCLQLYGIHFLFTVTISCGGQASENCTYFESSGAESGACRAKVCKCSSDICQVFFIKNKTKKEINATRFIFIFLQLRLDFNSFIIDGPSTNTLSTTSILGGQVIENIFLRY